MSNTPERRNIPWGKWNLPERNAKSGLRPVPSNRRALVESLRGIKYVSLVLVINSGEELLNGKYDNNPAHEALLGENWKNLRILIFRLSLLNPN